VKCLFPSIPPLIILVSEVGWSRRRSDLVRAKNVAEHRHHRESRLADSLAVQDLTLSLCLTATVDVGSRQLPGRNGAAPRETRPNRWYTEIIDKAAFRERARAEGKGTIGTESQDTALPESLARMANQRGNAAIFGENTNSHWCRATVIPCAGPSASPDSSCIIAVGAVDTVACAPRRGQIEC
jgi:hypothetical protein